MSTYLHLVCTQPTRISEVPSASQDSKQLLFLNEEAAHGIHSVQWWQEDRAARIALLRARVKSGTYTVDTMTLAQRILNDEIYSG
jgi:anti-sigma28 factor (negative regulator of flagellin synthesis)